MAQAPVPEGLSSIPDHGERWAPRLAGRAVNATGVSQRTDRRSLTA